MQAAGNRVRLAVELPAGVQRGQHDLDRGALLRRVLAYGDTAAVVDDPDAAVGKQCHCYGVAVARESLVHSVVHNLVHEVVEPALAGRADVHARPLTYRVEAFENFDRASVVGHAADLLGRVEVPPVYLASACSRRRVAPDANVATRTTMS
jgi:hypothetical protein